jgi:hypothetical protein
LDQLDAAVAYPETSLVSNIDALAACFRGLTPSEDDIFDADEDTVANDNRIREVKVDPRLAHIRQRAEQSIAAVVGVWAGDGEVADVSSYTIIPDSRQYLRWSSTLPSPKRSSLCRPSHY